MLPAGEIDIMVKKYCIMGVEMAARENENNANAKFWDDKQTTSFPGLFP